MIKLRYDTAKNLLDTMDILLFTAKGPISNFVKLVTWSKWSHVGSVLKIRGSLYCWESTTLNMSKSISGTKKGVQLTPLRKRIMEYDGDVAFRRLDIKRDIYFLKKISDFKKKMDDVEYEENYWELFKSTFDIGKFSKNRENLNRVFCSELTAEALQRGGIIGSNKPSNEYTPADFAKELPFINGSFKDYEPILINKE